MAKKEEKVQAPVKKAPTGYTTERYVIMKRLGEHKIYPIDNYGSPMVWVYAEQDTARIQAVLGT